MQPTLKSIILQNLLNREERYCTLCFTNITEEVHPLNITDQVIMKNENEKSFVELLNFILNTSISNEFLTNYICLQCAESALSSYSFIQMVKNNNEHFSEIVKTLTTALKNSLNENLECVKTLYLVNKDLNFQTCYDDKCDIKTVESAKMRLETVWSDKFSEDNLISIKIVPEENENNCYNKYMQRNLHTNNDLVQKKKTNRNALNDMCERDGNSNVRCKLCLKVYPTMTNFRSHYKRLHAPKTIECSKCPKVFGSTTILKQHMKESHMDAICSECGKAFKNNSYLKIHELSHRVNFTCDICKRVYKTKKTFNDHLSFNICSRKQRKNWTEAQFTCDICNKKFCRKTSLRVHIKFKHGNGKAYVCEWCSKRFSSKSHLNCHIMKHTKVKNFSCALCDGKFCTKQGLLIHTRLHTGEKPYQCSDCDATFISSTMRSRHMQYYHRNFRFECDVCCSKFRSKISLEKHKNKLICSIKEVLT